MAAATNLQAFLRFLSQDAKLPLATAMSKVKDLQSAHLDSTAELAKAKPTDLTSIFPDEKQAKQVIAAAKRVNKKRAAGDTDNATGPSPAKKKAKGSIFEHDVISPAELESSLELPTYTPKADDESESELKATVLFTNRAPLVLAFAVTLLKYTMPEQPVSSRLSLAQGYVSTTSRARAVTLGIESGRSAEEEGVGEGQPVVRVMGKEVRVLRRWGYEWKESEKKRSNAESNEDEAKEREEEADEQPALWALDLEALKKTGNTNAIVGNVQTGNHSNLPIYTPQSARSYIMRAFESAPASSSDTPSTKKPTATAVRAEKERNLGKLLHALDLVYASWSETLSAAELDRRTWSWYVKVRPEVADGVAGWGGKNELKLAEILALRREA